MSFEDVEKLSRANTNASEDAIKEEPNSPTPPSAPAPQPISLHMDTGLICWLQVVGSFALWANSWGLISTFGVFQTYYQTTLPQTPSQISWIGSIQAFGLTSVGVLSGPAFDAGYFTWLVGAGNLLVVFGLMMTSLCTRYWQAVLAQGIVCGIGFGFLFLPGIAIIPQYFVKRRLLASGIASTGSGVAGLVYPIIFRRLETQIGFGWAVRVIGFISLFLGIVSLVTMRSRAPPPSKLRKLYDVQAILEPPMALSCAGYFFCFTALWIPMFYIGVFGLDTHITDENLAFYLLPILNAGSIVGRLIPGYIADKVGGINTVAAMIAGSGILQFCWIAVDSTSGLIVLALLYGFFNGGAMGLAPSIVAALTSDMRQYGTRIGTWILTCCVGVLIGTPVSGAILKNSGSFLGVQLFGGCCLLVAVLLTLLGRAKKVGWALAKI